MTAPTPEQIAKLPQWAQQWIKTLEGERFVAVRQLNEYVDSQTPSKIYYDDYVCSGEEREAGKGGGPSNKRRYVQTDRLEVEHAGILLRVACHSGQSMHDNGIELQWSTTNATIDMIAMVPKSFQQVTLISHENMRVMKERVKAVNELNNLSRFKEEMKKIAYKNDDEFEVNVTVDSEAYKVTVTEKADGHVFLEGRGDNLVMAVRDARDNLAAALKEWGYAA